MGITKKLVRPNQQLYVREHALKIYVGLRFY